MNGSPSRNQGVENKHRHTAGMPVGFGDSADDILQHAFRSYSDEQLAISGLIATKLELLKLYDAPGMKNAVSICFWGRSGSWLLQSYLDNHEDIIILPRNGTHLVYPFLAEFSSLSVWEKLIAYPVYSEMREGPEGAFLKGEFAVAAADYYAAVQGLYSIYGDKPVQWLNTRQRFLQFLHVAYAVSAGRRPGNSRPLIIYVQHWTNDELARRFIDDFPEGRFIHTIRDPISTVDSWYDRQIELQIFIMEQRPDLAPRYLGRLSAHYLDPSGQTVRTLLRWDRPHYGMETRTVAIRFEDLHLTPETTMHRLADWLGVPYRPCLLESTFNGVPYVYQSGGVSWVGANPSNTRRRSKNLAVTDRWMIFALLHENFVTWNYATPRIFRRRWIRMCAIALLVLLPMKMELLNTQLVMKRQILPALRRGRIGSGCGAPLYLLMRRLVMVVFIAAQARSRLMGKRQVLTPL